MAEEEFKCPYCGRKTSLYERYCIFCDHDISKEREKMEKPACFIATAAYGSPFAAEIDVLRRWRNERLYGNFLGELFVKVYYLVSPPIAKVVYKSIVLKKIVRAVLKPVIRVLRNR